MKCYMPDRRRRVPFIRQKVAFDTLTNELFWSEDSPVVDYRAVKMLQCTGGKLEMTITELEAG